MVGEVRFAENLRCRVAGGYRSTGLEMITNTAPFDLSHRPAMAIPCGISDGLPVSMMLVGRHHDEPTIYRAVWAFEQDGDWRQM